MIEIAGLVLVIVALVSLIGWLDWNNRKERSKLINALVAKDAQELRDLEFVDKFQPVQQEEKTPDLTAVESLTDEEFDKAIQEELGG